MRYSPFLRSCRVPPPSHCTFGAQAHAAPEWHPQLPKGTGNNSSFYHRILLTTRVMDKQHVLGRASRGCHHGLLLSGIRQGAFRSLEQLRSFSTARRWLACNRCPEWTQLPVEEAIRLIARKLPDACIAVKSTNVKKCHGSRLPMGICGLSSLPNSPQLASTPPRSPV